MDERVRRIERSVNAHRAEHARTVRGLMAEFSACRAAMAGLADDDVPTLFVLESPPGAPAERGRRVLEWLLQPMAARCRGAYRAAVARPLRLRLLCMDTLSPVACGEDGGGYRVLAPAELLPKVAPLMRLALRAIALAGGVAAVARLLGVPTPVLETRRLREGLDALVAAAADAPDDEESGGRGRAPLQGAALREFKQFLLEVDPAHHWGGLQRRLGHGGSVIWHAPTPPVAAARRPVVPPTRACTLL